MRHWKLLSAAGILMAATSLVATRAGATAPVSRNSVTVDIVGAETFLPNGVHSTFHFPAAPTQVASGGFSAFNNQTNDGHTPTLIAAADLPTSFNCPLCDAVNGLYFPGNGPPAGFNIDNGTVGDDDTQADADAVDANGAPIEDFDTVSHSNGAAPPTIGDSTLIDANGSNNQGGPFVRTVQVTAPPGTVLHYFCTFHPWMQGVIEVQ